MIFHKRKAAAQPSAPRSPDILTLDNPQGWALGESTGPDAALKVSAVYRCVTYNAETISVMPFFVTDGSWNRLKDHPLMQVLQWRPNEMMSPADFKSVMEVNRSMRGNAYAYIGRNARTGRVEELLPLSPDLVTIHFDEGGNQHYLYSDPVSGKVWDLLPSQMLHYKAFSRDGIHGISPLDYARDVIAKDRAAKTYEQALYRNGARPSGVLYTDSDLTGRSKTPDPDHEGDFLSKKEVVRQAWERVYGGDNAFRTAVLDLGLKYQPIAMNNSDAQFIESNEITIADIARYFGTPLHVLMTGKQSYESNSENRVEFVQTTALSIVNRCEDEDSYKLLSLTDRKNGLRVCRDMNAALRGDTESRSKFYREMRDMGAYCVNDVLASEKLPAVPGGDVHLASLNYVPLELFRDLSRNRNPGKESEK